VREREEKRGKEKEIARLIESKVSECERETVTG
jgi:hypothetical protein